MRQKFNDILEETLVSRKNSFILDVKEAMKNTFFDQTGHLTGEGKIKFWLELDSLIQLFNKNEISLEPTPVVSKARNKLTSVVVPRKLPTPPPSRCVTDRSARSSSSTSSEGQTRQHDSSSNDSEVDEYYHEFSSQSARYKARCHMDHERHHHGGRRRLYASPRCHKHQHQRH